jgi:hypothetical protein
VAALFVSRSGSNQFRGKVFEFMRDDAFDSNNFFSKALGRASRRCRSTLAACSAALTIPKRQGRDRTFFASYEAYRNKTSAAPRPSPSRWRRCITATSRNGAMPADS